MFFKRRDQRHIDCLLPGSRIFDILSFGGFTRCFAFGGGSDSDSTQYTTTKDNSALVEDSGQNATDSGQAVKDEGILASGRRSSVFSQEGSVFHGARKNSLEPLPAAIIAGGIVFGVYLFSKR